MVSWPSTKGVDYVEDGDNSITRVNGKAGKDKVLWRMAMSTCWVSSI